MELLAGIAVGADGTLYAAGTDLTAYDPDGTVRWSVELPGAAYYIALDREQVVMQLQPGMDFDGGLIAVDRADGTVLWTSDVWAIWEPAIADDGTIYCASMAGLAAVDGGSGETIWTAEINIGPVALGKDDRLYGMAMLLEDEELPDLGSRLHFVVLSTSDGELLWKEMQNESVEALNHAPSFDGQRVYFGGGYLVAYVYAFDGGPGLGHGPWPRTGGDNAYRYKEQ
jgi:outer membrane protein assembly factor BamB